MTPSTRGDRTRARLGHWLAPLLALALALGVAPMHAWAAPAPSFASARTLRAKLAAAGRAEVSLVHTLFDDVGGAKPRRARLTLEPPDRVRLEFADDGECLTMRADGGEWLQPAASQLLVLPADQIEVGARLWRVLLGGGGPAWRERHPAAGRFVITPEPGAGEDAPFTSLTITLGADGLPRRLVTTNGNQRLELRFTGWRFVRARGAAAFRQTAKPGITVVRMP